jgi:outer membrane lipoprotein LolB
MRILRLFVALIFLAGCAVAPSRPPVSDPQAAWTAHRAALARIQTWDVRGRVAVRSGDDGVQASLLWVRESDLQRIELTGPFGGGRVRLIQNRDGAELHDTDNRVYRDSSLQRLLQRRVGWDLPISELNYWMLGLPAPGAVTGMELDEWGRLKVLQQSGWEIRLLEYSQQDGVELPSRLFVRRVETSTAPMEARLVVEKWTIRGRAN